MAAKVKPVPQREVAIKYHNEVGRLIQFYSTQDAISAFDGFGPMYHVHSDFYSLEVDPRFDFKEVLVYIENYG